MILGFSRLRLRPLPDCRLLCVSLAFSLSTAADLLDLPEGPLAWVVCCLPLWPFAMVFTGVSLGKNETVEGGEKRVYGVQLMLGIRPQYPILNYTLFTTSEMKR